jgi:hypothetical protein
MLLYPKDKDFLSNRPLNVCTFWEYFCVQVKPGSEIEYHTYTSWDYIAHGEKTKFAKCSLLLKEC